MKSNNNLSDNTLGRSLRGIDYPIEILVNRFSFASAKDQRNLSLKSDKINFSSVQQDRARPTKGEQIFSSSHAHRQMMTHQLMKPHIKQS